MIEQSDSNVRKRKIDLIEGAGFYDRTLKKIPKRPSGKMAIPKIAHIIWLSGESAGSAPSQRMLNIISLGKQLSTEGWHVKLWTNKAVVIERALSEIRLSNDSQYRGHQLETGTKLKYQAAGGRGIEICSDKSLFDILESINQESYKNACRHEEPRNFKETRRYAESCNKYDLTLLFTPNEALNDQSENNKSKLTDPTPFKRSLLDHYLLHSIGQFNYAAKSDYLRMAALLKYGGVYIDSDIEASSIKDPAFRQNKIRFNKLSARHGILLAKGWDTDFTNDLIAAKPGAWQVRHMLMDQFYWSNQLDQLPYVLWVRDKIGEWRLRTVPISSLGDKTGYFCPAPSGGISEPQKKKRLPPL